MADEIIKELWEIKDAIAREHGNDVRSRIAELKLKQAQSGQKVVDLRAKRKSVSSAKPFQER